MIPKAFLILALDALAVGAVQGKGWNGAGGFLSGTLLGLLCGATAVAGAAFAHARSLEVRQVLTVVFGGMAGRMALLGAWTPVSLQTLGLRRGGLRRRLRRGLPHRHGRRGLDARLTRRTARVKRCRRALRAISGQPEPLGRLGAGGVEGAPSTPLRVSGWRA
ncbi:MAG TPA: hypothetical protein DFS52_07140, partial [Myxococcales bacterium]|nr:hypothetical protein [Myxococcales bacterium]